ncbi:MAG: hypothetical protein H0U49_06725, partial [Parachlamydiaceae bacterium]|nr:hypothetical protein [Parachlamydiaceae bacterium]
EVDGKKISTAIARIKNCNDPEKKFNAVRILKSRISYKKLSDKLSIGANAISIISSVIFVVAGFVAAATPAAPVAYALLIGLTIYGIGKMIVDHQKKKNFEKTLDSDLFSPSTSQLEAAVRTKPVPQSSW